MLHLQGTPNKLFSVIQTSEVSAWFVTRKDLFSAHTLVTGVSKIEPRPEANVGASVSQQVDPPSTVTSHILIEKRRILDMCSSVIAQVEASRVPESTVQSLVGSMEELVNDIHVHAKRTVVNVCHLMHQKRLQRKLRIVWISLTIHSHVFTQNLKG